MTGLWQRQQCGYVWWNGSRCHKRPRSAERGLHLGVRIEHTLPAEQLDVLEEVAARTDRSVNLQPVLHTGLEVVAAMAGRGVDRTRALLDGHVVGEHAERRTRVERVLEADVLELSALHAHHRRAQGAAGLLRDRRGERLGQDHDPAVDVVGAVIDLRVEGDGEVRRDGPRGRGPDQDRDRTAGQRRHSRAQFLGALLRQQELDVDRRRGVILVLDFGFGERGPAVDAPVHRLLAFVDQTLLDEPPQRARDRRLVLEVHRQVQMFPVAEHAEALELDAHDVDEPGRIGAARPAEIGHRHLALLRPELAIDLQLDRQAMAVVAQDVRGIEAHHRARLDHEILEDLVHRGAEMDAAVGVRRTIVQDEPRPALTTLLDLCVEAHLLPARERLRLRGRQARLHREVGPRQVERVFPVRHGYPAIVVGRPREL